MQKDPPEPASQDQWTLIRRARQLVTLRGPAGPRRGPALADPGVIKDGSLLIHNGLVREAGSSQRVESLKQARKAREIDVAGKIVIPAFVDADSVLVAPPPGKHDPSIEPAGRNRNLGLMSRHLLTQSAAAAAADLVRLGVLSAGAHTGHAPDLKNALRALRIHQSLQGKPLRIRSIYAPPLDAADDAAAEVLLAALISRALPVVKSRKLAAVIELTLDPDAGADAPPGDRERRLRILRQAAIAAAGSGYSIRLRAFSDPAEEMREFMLGAIPIALIVPPAGSPAALARLAELAAWNCLHVLSANAALRPGWQGSETVRREIDAGIPLALGSGFEPGQTASLNPQFLLHLAVERCGMSPAEALVAATYNAACSLRLSRVTGSLEENKYADLLVVDVPDYRDLPRRVGHSDVQLVMRRGNPVYRRGSLIPD